MTDDDNSGVLSNKSKFNAFPYAVVPSSVRRGTKVENLEDDD